MQRNFDAEECCWFFFFFLNLFPQKEVTLQKMPLQNKENNETKAFLSYSKLKCISMEQVKMI